MAEVLAAGVVFFAMQIAGMPAAQGCTGAVTTLCAVWWVFDSLPLAATSLVPLVVFTITGVLTEEQAAAAYGDPIVLLFMGGFMLSAAAERWGAHSRIAHAMLAATGATNGPRVLLAFMLTTAFISMWISNTATALLMLPVAMAVLEQDKSKNFAVPLLLAVAYSSNIGGIATPIGTPPNGVFVAAYKEETGRAVPFHEWMLAAGLVAVLMLFAAWLVLSWRARRVASVEISTDDEWTSAQIRALVVFALAAAAWITREVPYGGWSMLVGAAEAGDITVAIAAALAMFIIPSGEPNRSRLLDGPTAVRIPWGVLILFGGGIAIAAAFKSSGLSDLVGKRLGGLNDLSPLAIIGLVCLAVTFLSELTSNTATANILMPLLAAAAKAYGIDPALLMFPATLSNSLAFMMPVGTPPNAIAFGSGQVRMADMVRVGLILNLVGATIVTLICWWLLPSVFGLSIARP